jgi:aspartyl-tRNA(Asn)/glutamyl-tRNA(Gln) amidotransferase subunit C
VLAGPAAFGFAPGGGFGIALDDPNLFQVGAAVPAGNWPGPRPCWRVETVPGASVKAPRRAVKEPLTIERLAAWAERLRGSDKPSVAASEAPAAAAGRDERARAIRAVDVVAVRRIVQPAETAAPRVRYRRHPELAGDALRSVVPCRLFPLRRGRAQLSALEADAGDRDPGQHQSGFDDHLTLQGDPPGDPRNVASRRALQRKSGRCYRRCSHRPHSFESHFMSVDHETVRRIARLARIAVVEDDVPHLQGELNAILSFVEQLNEVDVEGVEPMTSVTPMAMKKRADAVTDGGYADAIVKNAPATEDHFFLVPKVVE